MPASKKAKTHSRLTSPTSLRKAELRPGISACIITLNEEDNLPRCLQSIEELADEIVVLDSGSNDRTVDIAHEFQARVFRRDFDGYVNQKNHIISLVRHEWILVIDADEVITPGLANEIKNIIQRVDPPVAYRIPRMSFYLGRWIRHSGWYPDYNIRLFRAGCGVFQGGTVHETVIPIGPVGTLQNHLEHYSYGDISDHLLRIDQYSTLIAQDKHSHGKRSSIVWAVVKSFSKFCLTYFYRLGFLDGRAGLVIAVMAGYYNFLKYVKLWELNRGLRKFRTMPEPPPVAPEDVESLD